MGQNQSKYELVYQQVSYGNAEGIKTLCREGTSLEGFNMNMFLLLAKLVTCYFLSAGDAKTKHMEAELIWRDNMLNSRSCNSTRAHSSREQRRNNYYWWSGQAAPEEEFSSLILF